MKSFQPITSLIVEIDFGEGRRKVGRLAWRDRVGYFQYDPDYLVAGPEISPIRLKKSDALYEGTVVFGRLHGVFNDSLPDGWGRLLMDRKLAQVGVTPSTLSPLDRLAWIGDRGMGALVYRPEHPALVTVENGIIDLDVLAEQSRRVIKDSPTAVLDDLLRIGGSPQGARPKALVAVSADKKSLIHGDVACPAGYDLWLVKFRSGEDSIDAGAIEMAYSEMARLVGIDMPETALFPAKRGPGYFGVRRFDQGERRHHMHTLSGLLEADHTMPSVGYVALLNAARLLTRHQAAVDALFVRMVFNIVVGNRDAHAKNHAFLMSADGTWTLSPAYDLTWSDGPGGEHALDVAGVGRSPGRKDALAVAAQTGVDVRWAAKVIDEVCSTAVTAWKGLAKNQGVSVRISSEIGAALSINARLMK